MAACLSLCGRYIAAKGMELLELLANNEGPMADLIDASLLRFRERDELEGIFKSWDGSVPCVATAA